MDRWAGRVALVTGASVGIGAAICRKLVDAGMLVVGAARGVDQIEALAKELDGKPGKLVAVKCDLTKDQDIENLFEYIKKNHEGVDVCINNAGMSRVASLLEGTTEQWREMINVNVIGLCFCTKLAIQSMRERNVDDGHVVHISSILGHYVVDNANGHFYMATKWAIRALTEGLRQELRAIKTNIRISSISPGVVETEFANRMYEEKDAMKRLCSSFPHILTADNVAESVCHILAAPISVQIQDILLRPNQDQF